MRDETCASQMGWSALSNESWQSWTERFWNYKKKKKIVGKQIIILLGKKTIKKLKQKIFKFIQVSFCNSTAFNIS